MNTNKEKFYAIAESESQSFNSLIEVMAHTKKCEARRFLMVMNSIVEYYLNRTATNDEICYPIIRIPHASDWAKEVLMKFLILKLSLHYNSDTISQLKKKYFATTAVYLIDDADNAKYHNYIVPCKAYLKKVFREIPHNFLGESGHKNIIFCSEGDMRVSREDKNKYISEFYGEVDDVFTEKNLIMCQNVDADDIRHKLREQRDENQPLVDNVFVFYTNNNRTNSLEATSLERWNSAYHVGIKNCFIFDFSEEPFRLRNEIRRGSILCKKFPMIPENEFLQYRHFITFDEQETNSMFGWKNQYKHKVFNDDQLMFSDILSSLLNEAEYRIQERNRFALCLNQSVLSAYQKYLSKEFDGYSNDDYQLSFDWQVDVANNRITPLLNNLISSLDNSTATNIAVVIDKSTPNELKTEFSDYLRTIRAEVHVKFYDYSALKPIKGKNGIKEPLVIVLQYRPHYIQESYAKYPNSFDPYVVNKGQYICDIIQGFIFQDMYDWDKYDYDNAMFELFSSDYRESSLDRFSKPIKPTFKRIIGENEFSDERGNIHSTIYVKGMFEDGQRFNIPETNFILYKIDNEQYIGRLSDLKRANLLHTIEQFQELDAIAEYLKVFIQKKQEEADIRERFIRDSYYQQGKISREEQLSPISLWKILLAQRIASKSWEKVFEEVKRGLKETEQISENQFKTWADLSNDMMLPRSKVHQRRLFEFLGFGAASPYLFIMRNKKAVTKNGTRKLNAMMDQFLSKVLLRNIDNELYEEIYESEINDLLELQKMEDLTSLVEMLCEGINLKKIKEIS